MFTPYAHFSGHCAWVLNVDDQVRPQISDALAQHLLITAKKCRKMLGEVGHRSLVQHRCKRKHDQQSIYGACTHAHTRLGMQLLSLAYAFSRLSTQSSSPTAIHVWARIAPTYAHTRLYT
jgi:hypothetical protein